VNEIYSLETQIYSSLWETNFEIKMRNIIHAYIDDEAPLCVGNTEVSVHRL
jgi:hypothetical protein